MNAPSKTPETKQITPTGRFVFIVDSYAKRTLDEELEKLGLSKDEYHTTGAGGSRIILSQAKWLGAERLLVFMSSFHGSTEPAVALSRKIKAANPNARIIFRSTEQCSDPVFDRSMPKDFDYCEILAIVKEFLAK